MPSGKKVSVIELQPQALPRLDAEIAQPLEYALREKGVELILGDGIDGCEANGREVSTTDCSCRSPS